MSIVLLLRNRNSKVTVAASVTQDYSLLLGSVKRSTYLYARIHSGLDSSSSSTRLRLANIVLSEQKLSTQVRHLYSVIVCHCNEAIRPASKAQQRKVLCTDCNRV
eukprot:14347-Heterococcus_DN1.PRE.3